MIKGVGGFDPIIDLVNGDIGLLSKKIESELAFINEWLTVMNILEYNCWNDPLTNDMHIVLKKNKLVSADHIGQAAELVDEPTI